MLWSWAPEQAEVAPVRSVLRSPEGVRATVRSLWRSQAIRDAEVHPAAQVPRMLRLGSEVLRAEAVRSEDLPSSVRAQVRSVRVGLWDRQQAARPVQPWLLRDPSAVVRSVRFLRAQVQPAPAIWQSVLPVQRDSDRSPSSGSGSPGSGPSSGSAANGCGCEFQWPVDSHPRGLTVASTMI